MNVWNWLSDTFSNGEIFFYVVPVFLLIVLVIVIFLPEKKEEIETKPAEDEKKDPGIDFKREPQEGDDILQVSRRVTIDLTAPSADELPEPDKDSEVRAEELISEVKSAIKEAAAERIEEEDSSKINELVESIGKKVESTLEAEEKIESQLKVVEEEPAKIEAEAKNYSQGLEKTRGGFISKLKNLFKSSVVDDDMIDEMEEILYTADIGVETVSFFMSEIHKKRKDFTSGDDVRNFLKDTIRAIMKPVEKTLNPGENNPSVVLMVGVNGAGKTTTIGKLTKKFKDSGKSVVLAAGDTFRAAAVEQLTEWGRRNDVDVISEKEGADPAAVAYNAINSALSKNKDIVIVDTAGRLQNRVNLMEELKKVHRVIGKAKEGAPHEVILVVDANNGQNALVQAKQFNEAISLSGIVITKLDGTAKGGVVIGIARELKLPIYFIGIGESVNDLKPFSADEYVEALFE